MIWFDYDDFEEHMFAYLRKVEKSNLSNEEKYGYIDKLLGLLMGHSSIVDTYDEYYEDVDRELEESQVNFSSVDFIELQELFSCQGILDDDDLNDFDGLVDSVGENDECIFSGAALR